MNFIAILFCATSVLFGGCTEKHYFGVDDLPDGAVSIKDYSSYRNGSDWAPAFERAFKENDYIFVPSGSYDCSEVKVPSGKIIAGAGSSSVFVPKGRTLFSVEGKCGEGVPISSDIPDWSNSISVSDRRGFGKGDDILILSQRNSMLREGIEGVNYDTEWVMGRTRKTNVFYGEFDNIANISGLNIITSGNRAFPSYFCDESREPEPPTDGFITRSTTTVHRLDMKKDVVLKDFSVSGTRSSYRVIALKYAKDCLLENIVFNTSVECYAPDGITPSLTLVHATYCRNVCVRSCSSVFSSSLVAKLSQMEKIYANFSIYNLFKVISCWESGFERCSSNFATHAFSITRSSSASGFTSGNCYIRDCISSGNIWSGITVQQGTWKSELSGNIVTKSGQGIACAGRAAIIRNNKLSTDLPYETNYYYTHISSNQTTDDGKVKVFWGGTCGIMLNEGYSCGAEEHRTVVEGNDIAGFYTAIAVRDGYENKNIFEEGFIDISGNAARNVNIGFGVYLNAFNVQERYFDIILSKNSFKLTEKGQKTYIPERVSGIRIMN